jgi:tight adherence protein C
VSNSPALLAVAFTISLLCAVGMAVILLRNRSSQQRIRRGLESAVRESELANSLSTGPMLQRALNWVRMKLSLKNQGKLRDNLRLAGFRTEWQAGAYQASRLLLPLLALAGSTFLPQFGLFGAAMLVFIAYLLPDLWLSSMIRRRREQIRLALPDTLDLLVICVEAGLGLDQALNRVGSELAIRHKAMSEEIAHINVEQRAGKPRLEAWRSMAQRVKLEEIEAFVAMLWQSERFGTPIIRALATFSESLRTTRRQQAEELAAKATVKLLFPLVIFIFPSMFIVLIGPAALNIMHNLGGLFD